MKRLGLVLTLPAAALLSVSGSPFLASPRSAGTDGIRARSNPTWTLRHPAIPAHSPALNINCPARGICYLLSRAAETTKYPVGGSLVYTTSDGGQSWAPHHPRVPASAVLRSLVCPTASVCFGIGDTENGIFYDRSNPAVVVRTTDGGKSWHVVLTVRMRVSPPPGLTCALRTLPCERLDSIACPTALVCYVTGSSFPWKHGGSSATRRLWRSTDGGQTWQRSTPGHTNGFGGEPIACPTTTTCFTASGLVTTNGGQTWTRHSAAAGWSSMSCPTAETCLGTINSFPDNGDALRRAAISHAAAPDILVTTDGGRTWNHTRTLRRDTELGPISCPSAMECYAGGVLHLRPGGGIIVATDDGGRTWHRESIQSKSSVVRVLSISCPTSGWCRATAGDPSGLFLLVRGPSRPTIERSHDR